MNAGSRLIPALILAALPAGAFGQWPDYPTYPKTYTKPWTVSVKQKIMLDQDLIEFICDENEKDAAHLTNK